MLSMALALGISAASSAQVAGPPASQPAPLGLPPGHPAIPADDGTSILPPRLQPNDGAGNLPQGHPEIGPARKAVAHGSLSLHATQGTAGGTKPAGDPVVIDLYSAAPTPQHFEGQLDASGTLVLPDITITGACQPLIKVTHAGVPYQGIGQVMDAAHTGEKVEVKVFDTTEQQPQWVMKMRHVIIHRSPAGLDVIEMIMLDSPGDRVWLGTGDGKEPRITLDLPLPAAAQNVQFGDGLKAGNASVKDGRLINTAPLIPGTTQLQFSYTLPVGDGKAQITLAAPVATGHLMMFVPDDGSTVTGDGLIPAGSGNAPGGTSRFFMVPSVPAGKELKVDFTHLAGPTTKAAADDGGEPGTAQADSTGSPQADSGQAPTEPVRSRSSMPVIIGVGSAVLLVGGTIAIFARPAAKKT